MNSVYLHLTVIFMAVVIKGNVLTKLPKHSQECATLLESYASASAQFMFCTLQNSRPVHICCSCIDEYNGVLDKHDQIIRAKQNQNSSCNESLINQDRLEVIESSYSYVIDLWSKGQCKNCFNNNNTLSNTTKEFILLYSNTNQCLEDNYYPKNKSYNPDVCLHCSEKYYKMSKFYAKLKETNGNGFVCMDVVDTLNVTQHLWSNVLHCGETVMTFELPLIIISCVFCIFPIIFYLHAWKSTKTTFSTVLNQNRLSQRFRERWRSRAGSSVST